MDTQTREDLGDKKGSLALFMPEHNENPKISLLIAT